MSASNKQTTLRNVPMMPRNLEKNMVALLRVPSSTTNDKLVSLYVEKELNKMGLRSQIDESGNMIVHKGSGMRPCFVSHLDTVHDFVPQVVVEIVEKDGHRYLTSKQGVGGDDKCGVWVCLRLLKMLENVTVVFFANEEVGCKGSNHIDFSTFKQCNSIIGIDRWGGGDYVNTYLGRKTTSKEFDDTLRDVLEYYGFADTSGLLTDSLNLADRGVGVPCVNLSCGYYAHHTLEEYIDTNETYWTLRLCEEIGMKIMGKKFVHKLKKVEWKNAYASSTYYFNEKTWRNKPTSKYTDKEWDLLMGKYKRKNKIAPYTSNDGEKMWDYCDRCDIYSQVEVYKGKHLCKWCEEAEKRIELETPPLPSTNPKLRGYEEEGWE